MTEKTSAPVSMPRRRPRQLRLAGVIVLLLGICGAGVVYWRGTRTPDLSDDPSMIGYNRAEERQMGVLYGKQGELIEDFSNDLKQPGTQAEIVIAAAVVIASGCFYFARLLDHDDPANV